MEFIKKSTDSKVSLSEAELLKIDTAYSSEPWWYDIRGFLILTFSYRNSLMSQIRFFSKSMGPAHLEVAIGTGTLFELILKWRKWKKLPLVQVLGFDYAERMLAGARKRFAKEKQLKLLRADAAQLDLPNNSFDSANIANAIHCLPDINGSFKEMHRVLKNNGVLVGNCLIEPKGHSPLDWLSRAINKWGIKKGILYRTYKPEEIENLLTQIGFHIEVSQVKGNCFNFVARKVILV